MKVYLFILIGVMFSVTLFSQFKKVESLNLKLNPKVYKNNIKEKRIEKDLAEDAEEYVGIDTSIAKENDTQDKEALKQRVIETRGQSDFDYLDGYNLSDATFQYTVDAINYASRFDNNEFIPQGLSKDHEGNLLISMYHITNYWN